MTNDELQTILKYARALVDAGPIGRQKETALAKALIFMEAERGCDATTRSSGEPVEVNDEPTAPIDLAASDDGAAWVNPDVTECCGRPALMPDGTPLVRYRQEAGSVTCIGCFRVYAALDPGASVAREKKLASLLYG